MTKWMKWTKWALMIGGFAIGGLAWGEMSEEPVRVLESAKACGAKGGMCFQAGTATAMAGESNRAPRFTRASAVAAAGKSAPRDSGQPWTLEVAAQLKKPAVAGNALFVFFDLADPSSIKKQENVALFQATVRAGKALGAHLSLSNEYGFRPGHSYRLRIAQLLNGREVVLAEGDFTLL